MSAGVRWLLAVLIAPGLLAVCTVAVLSLVQGPTPGARDRPLRSAVAIDARRFAIDTTANTRSAAAFSTRIDEALRETAIGLMPDELTAREIRRQLINGYWNADGTAVAVSLPRRDATLTYVFRRRPDGSYAGADVSWIADDAFAFIGWPRGEYERFETEPVGWRQVGRDYLRLSIRTRAWHGGQRYTATSTLSVAGDGTVSGR